MEPLPRETLVRELAALPEAERRAVVRAARDRARTTVSTLPWVSLRAVIGIVHGASADAIQDCDRLYDG